jgi:phosphatidate cytidylyltransferase
MLIGRDLLPRFASAIVLGAIAVVGAWLGGMATAILVAAAAALVHLEWTGITEGSQRASPVNTAVIAAVMLIAGVGYVGIAGAVALVAAGVAIATGPWRAAGVAYASVFGLSLLILRAADDGLAAIAFLFAAVWATDIGAYFTGRAIGGPKLWPAVSPKKTWAGAIGGVVSAILAGLATAAVANVPLVPILVVVIVALSIAGQCGDLFESFVKRRFGAKDAGTIIPGHGGMMDRVDGLVFAGAVAVSLGFLQSGGSEIARGLIWW